ncbi:hypothetical protein EV144_103314 [Flavobacterium sp. 270]|uniref:hypothetical protein n=1 Tax=Flavobacterium sp. 270 TaxID=2512114 RepID=UPI001065CA0A|nr:hypothetical protein [Flavobacterium sp. 270]TDW48797.1 hypothetical protein EV144_103314 [Flavobacterium sp. 270]
MNTYKYNNQETDYLNHQNNSNTGYNVALLANELTLALREKLYSLENDDDLDQEEIDEMNESEKYAVD